VPSSTSSSEPRAIPGGEWGSAWLFALALALGLGWTLERCARDHGQRPNVVDDPVSWALARRSVDDDERVVAFVGSSRMELAYSARAFVAAAPRLRGVQLSINAVASIGVLADLAADEHFAGLAIVDLIEWDVTFGDPYDTAKPYVDRAHALWRAPGALVNRWLAAHVQPHLAILAVGGRPLLGAWLHARWPTPTWVASDRDRTSRADYSVASAAELERKALQRLANFDVVPTPDVWLARAGQLEPLVQQIRAHGGDVVFVRTPISGKLAFVFDARYPRSAYWDRFARATSATVIDARDLPALSAVQCPDEIHLDGKDQDLFTTVLVEQLRARGVLRGRE
jgi:hypothetical protein